MIVSRPTAGLDAARVAAAAIESVAENASDSVVAPLFWYAAGGLPAAWVYRAVNTMDAMIGYRNARYEHLGKAAARLDDALNWVPARLTAWLLVALAPLAGGGAAAARQTMARDGAATASPNAGQPMAAMAGALGVELEKVGHYVLGRGQRLPGPDDLRRAIRLLRLVSFGAVVLAAAARRR
jgi:adenosylcobinamide-phosphate synthase